MLIKHIVCNHPVAMGRLCNKNFVGGKEKHVACRIPPPPADDVLCRWDFMGIIRLLQRCSKSAHPHFVWMLLDLEQWCLCVCFVVFC